jgi:hypothetical protein
MVMMDIGMNWRVNNLITVASLIDGYLLMTPSLSWLSRHMIGNHRNSEFGMMIHILMMNHEPG